MKSKVWEKYEYLFIDIEWNQKAGTSDVENREPIQIGIIAADENLECQKLFSKSIRLNDVETLTEKTCKMAHVNKESVMQAKTEKEVFDKVKQSFPFYKYVVVWTMSAYEVFQAGAQRTNVKMPRHKVLVLQDILNLIAMNRGEQLGFEMALMKAGISYEPNYLHYSKHDVRYLHELFKCMYFKYAVITEGESSIVNARTKIIHSPDCRYVKDKNYETVTNAKRLLFCGYRTCRYCETEQKWRKFRWTAASQKKKRHVAENVMRTLPLTEKNIQLICRKFGIKCSIASGVIFLTTTVGYWRVYVTEGKVDKVLHGNYRISKTDFKKKKKKCNEGYHEQNISIENFYDIAKYIYYHDKYMFKNNKTRIDILFEKIQQEV